uniref:Uncharacterized protein n=1 Tax=Dendroctonus ponderosae TaxID=77166 RepID=A0AAR5QG54_DENPD
MSTFMNLQMDDDPDLVMKAPYIPMNFSDDLPLLMSTDLMWNNNDKNKSNSRVDSGSTLAQMLGSSANKRPQKGTDRGGGTVEETNADVINEKTSNCSWSTKLSPKMEVDSVGQMDRSPNLKRSNNSNYEHQKKKK